MLYRTLAVVFAILSLAYSTSAKSVKAEAILAPNSDIMLRNMSGMAHTMRAIVAKNGACSLEMRPLPTAAQGECLVRVAYSAINRADTLQRKGQYPPPPGVTDILGLELAGEVVSYNPPSVHGSGVPLPAVTRPGARVMALVGGGGNAEYAAVHASHLLPVPEGMSLRTAGAIPETWLTAYQLLHLVARLQKGERVLIHAAGSGVGTAAVQLAKAAGCTVYAVAGTDEKLAVARGLGADYTFNYKSNPTGWQADALASTPNGTAGVHVILDPVGGSFWRANAEAIGMDGRWVLYGSMGGVSVDGGLFATILRKRVQLLGTTLRARSDAYKAELTAAFARDALPLLASGAVQPVIDSEYALEEAQAAHERMESNVNTGKILLTVQGRSV